MEIRFNIVWFMFCGDTSAGLVWSDIDWLQSGVRAPRESGGGATGARIAIAHGPAQQLQEPPKGGSTRAPSPGIAVPSKVGTPGRAPLLRTSRQELLLQRCALDKGGAARPWQRVSRGGADGLRGCLRNEGNTCFLNAALQATFNCDAVLSLLSSSWCEDAHPSLALWKQTEEESRPASNIRKMVDWKVLVESFGMRWGAQSSAGEFLHLLLAEAARESPQFKASSGVQMRKSLEERFLCDCSLPDHLRVLVAEQSVSEAAIQLDLGKGDGPASLQRLLGELELPDMVTDARRRCPACGTEGQVSESWGVVSTSHLVCLCIARQQAGQGARWVQNNRAVLIEPSVMLGQRAYQVQAIVEKLGREADSGHYVCWCASRSKWARYDDDRVEVHDSLPESVRHGAVVVLLEAMEGSPGAIARELQGGAARDLPESVSSEALACVQVGAAQADAGLQDVSAAGADTQSAIVPAAQGLPAHGLPPNAPGGAIETRKLPASTADRFHKDVGTLLELWLARQNWRSHLRDMPMFLASEGADALEDAAARFQAGARAWLNLPLSVESAAHVQMPFWECTCYPLAVVMGALSKCTGTPALLYMDAFMTLATSLIHKDVSVRNAHFRSRARFWSIATAAPGCGKNPALDPLKAILISVMKKFEHLAPGSAASRFHCQQASTHAAAIDRLRKAKGHLYIGTAEGGPLQCPSWPTQGTWDQARFINFQFFWIVHTGAPWSGRQCLSGVQRKMPRRMGETRNCSTRKQRTSRSACCSKRCVSESGGRRQRPTTLLA